MIIVKQITKYVVRFIILAFFSFNCITNIPLTLIAVSLANGIIIYLDRNYTSDMV